MLAAACADPRRDHAASDQPDAAADQGAGADGGHCRADARAQGRARRTAEQHAGDAALIIRLLRTDIAIRLRRRLTAVLVVGLELADGLAFTRRGGDGRRCLGEIAQAAVPSAAARATQDLYHASYPLRRPARVEQHVRYSAALSPQARHSVVALQRFH